MLEALQSTMQGLSGNDEGFGGVVLPLSGVAVNPALVRLISIQLKYETIHVC